jgi:hypothetical protein
LSTQRLIPVILGVLFGLLPAVGAMVWLDENEWILPDPWGRVIPLPSAFDGRWSGTATFFDARGTPNCVWVPDIVMIVSDRGSHAKVGVSYSATRPRTRSVAQCPAHSSVTEHPIETSPSGSLGLQDAAGNKWSLVRERQAMSGEIEASIPGRPGAFYGEDVYLSQELEGQDPRAPYRLVIMVVAFGLGYAIVSGFGRLRLRN